MRYPYSRDRHREVQDRYIVRSETIVIVIIGKNNFTIYAGCIQRMDDANRIAERKLFMRWVRREF